MLVMRGMMGAALLGKTGKNAASRSIWARNSIERFAIDMYCPALGFERIDNYIEQKSCWEATLSMG